MTLPIVFQQQRLRATAAPQSPLRSRFDPYTPPVFQTGAWQCSAASTAWVLQSLGYAHSQNDVVELLGANNINPELGLLFGDGRGLVALLQRLGLDARSQQPVSYDEVLAMAGTKPIAMSGAAFYHWVGVRGCDGGSLVLANPAPGWREIQQSLSRAQFGALGPFAAVWVETEPARSVELTFDPTADQI